MKAIKDLLQRIRTDRKNRQGTWIGIDESHIILNALEKSERIEAENAELRARLEKAVEVENKINNGELVGAIWFKSWLNGQICCGRVIGYDDGGFVIESGDDLISAKKIYTSRQQAENGENKNGDDLPF